MIILKLYGTMIILKIPMLSIAFLFPYNHAMFLTAMFQQCYDRNLSLREYKGQGTYYMKLE